MTDSVESHIESLTESGFHRIAHAPRDPAIAHGARVHNRGEQFHSAYEHGTATVRAVMRRGTDESPDAWERTYGRPNVEVVVERDTGEIVDWSDYGTHLAENQPEPDDSGPDCD